MSDFTNHFLAFPPTDVTILLSSDHFPRVLSSFCKSNPLSVDSIKTLFKRIKNRGSGFKSENGEQA